MHLARPTWLLGLIPIAVISFCFWLVWSRSESTREQLRKRQERIDQETAQAEAARKAYLPKAEVDWATLPRVVKVEKLVEVAKPTQRLIHVRDLPYLPKDVLAKDVPARELESVVAENLLQVELVQIDERALLSALIQHHDLKSVVLEGLTQEALPDFHAQIKQLREAKIPNNPRARSQHQEEWLAMGAASQLLRDGELKEVLPLDTKSSLQQSSLKARQDILVAQALKTGDQAVIILAGPHDLSASVRAASKTCAYVRLTTKNYPDR